MKTIVVGFFVIGRNGARTKPRTSPPQGICFCRLNFLFNVTTLSICLCMYLLGQTRLVSHNGTNNNHKKHTNSISSSKTMSNNSNTNANAMNATVCIRMNANAT